MAKKKKRHSKVTTNRRVLLELFTEQDLELWSSRSQDAQRYSDYVYFDLERQRAAHHDQLCEALRSSGSIEIDLEHWARVCDYRWSLQPLSPAGSLKGIGGRFNIGSDLDRARGQQFPALYIAENVETAYFEFFGGRPETRGAGGLSLQELALRRKTSFVTFALRGHAENVLDLRSPSTIRDFAKIIAKFELSSDTRRFARKINLPLARSCEPIEMFISAYSPRPRSGALNPSSLEFPRQIRFSVAMHVAPDSRVCSIHRNKAVHCAWRCTLKICATAALVSKWSVVPRRRRDAS